MASIIPLRGFRYDQKDHDIDPSAVVTQPYDRIGDKEQATYYGRHPYNIVRIIKGRQDDGDVYSNAGQYLSEWTRDGVLKRDSAPSLYVYHQEYSYQGQAFTRKGVIALGKLEPEKVHAHEQTLRGPKEDRLHLMRATEANFGHIFMLYSDPDRQADRSLQASIEGTEPLIQATDEFGNRHLVWRVDDPDVIAHVQQAIADKDLYIADGHHRYETAATFMRECQDRGWSPAAPESFDVRMMTLFNIDEPGMTIRPIHRLIHGVEPFDPEQFLSQAAEDFQIRKYDSVREMTAAVDVGRQGHTFGCYMGAHVATLSLRDEALMDRIIQGDESADWKRLDVSILHKAIMERYLGIDARALEEETNVTYVRDPEDAVRQVDEGQQQIFFYLNPTSPSEVRRVADHGEKMPQKSTDFYPKLLTGLVISRMEINKT